MPDYQNPYIRLQTYYTWLINDENGIQTDKNYEYGIPIARLHKLTGIPLQILRNDMFCLYQNDNRFDFGETDSREEDSLNEDFGYFINDEKYTLDNLIDKGKDPHALQILRQLFSSGQLDHVPISLAASDDRYKTCQISLTAEEADALRIYQKDENTNGKKPQHRMDPSHTTYAPRSKIKDSCRFTHFLPGSPEPASESD